MSCLTNTREKQEGMGPRKRLLTSLLLLLLALVGISVATYSWFTISDHAHSKNMRLDVTGDNLLRFDLDAHDSFEEYTKTLNFSQIGSRMQAESGFDMNTSNLQPVTTSDYSTFTFEDGTVASKESGAYLEFTLHFISLDGCVVHLSSADGTNGEQGTKFSSSLADLPSSMRMCFSSDNRTWVYDPNQTAVATTSGSVTIFGMASSSEFVADDSNAMFSLAPNEDKAVVVRIWMEGTDSHCTNALKGGDYAISMRFEGTRLTD